MDSATPSLVVRSRKLLYPLPLGVKHAKTSSLPIAARDPCQHRHSDQAGSVVCAMPAPASQPHHPHPFLLLILLLELTGESAKKHMIHPPAAFLGVLARNCIRSLAAETQSGAPMACQCYKWLFILLCHSTGLHILHVSFLRFIYLLFCCCCSR